MRNRNYELEQIIDAIPSLIFLKDRENVILRVNQATLDAYGWVREEVEGQHSAKVFPEDAERFHRDDLAIIASGQAKLGYTQMAGDIWIRTDKIPVRNEAGEIDRILVVSTDITAEAEVEQRRLRSLKLLERAGEIANVGGWEVTIDPASIVWSPQTCRIHGVPEGYQPEMTEAVNFYAPEWRPVVEELVRVGIEDHQSWDVEAELIKADGTLIWVRAIGEPEIVDGKCVRLWGTLQDITEAREARTRLRDSEERLELALVNANVGLWDWNARTNNVFYSDTFKSQLGYSVDLPWNHFEHWRTLIHPDDVADALSRVNDYIEGRSKEYESRFRMLTADGQYRWIQTMGKASFDISGKAQRVTGVHVDVTEQELQRRRVETLNAELQQQAQELKQANQNLEEFAYVASHDLKSPLRAIHHLATWLTEDLTGELPASSERHLEQLQQRVQRMERLLDDLLTYSRAGRVHGEIVEVPLAELIDDTWYICAADVGYSLETELEVSQITADRTELGTIFRNLIGNAIKHHDKTTGTVTVKSSIAPDDPRFVRFQVVDDGPGVPDDQHDRAFMMFQTLRPRDEVEGSGMGLALVKRLVELQNGQIWMESSSGRGATVCFTWPASRPAAQQDDKNNLAANGAAKAN